MFFLEIFRKFLEQLISKHTLLFIRAFLANQLSSKPNKWRFSSLQDSELSTASTYLLVLLKHEQQNEYQESLEIALWIAFWKFFSFKRYAIERYCLEVHTWSLPAVVICRVPSALLSPSSKYKKIHSKKNSYIFLNFTK